ncbi:MAG: thioredoxin domain-containing protein [Opitutus sp.]
MPNALAHEKSPYLLQHAENPVAWLPWGEAAFARARAEQKPIFLSIGYATCHWCHVMAHESFENEEIAALLNASFVPIKVDREERPDVDKVYMTYVQAMSGHGGWPLSAWLTPELKPFFGGTYFPPEDRKGRAGFPSLLRAIANGWTHEREKLVAEGDRVIEALREHAAEKQSIETEAVGSAEETLAEAGAAAFEKCFQHLYESFDPTNGGFGGAPKFPRASNLDFLFRAAAMQGASSEAGAEAVKLASATLQAMARGGIHDHVGGGYHRYSVDESWFVPHFEKMLYDQAQIAVNALQAKQATGDERFGWMARDIFDYVLRDLAHGDGGFYSAEDADSLVTLGRTEHAEGAFYVWTQAEIAAALGDDAPLFCAHAGVAENGNVPTELDPQGELAGKNILTQRQSLVTTARRYNLSPEETSDRIVRSLEKLRAVRERRPRPLRDDKIITAWNGLMISALARGYQIFGHDEGPAAGQSQRYLDAAIRAAEFIRRELYDEGSNVLYRSWRQNRGATEGFAEDYACLIQGLLDLYEAGFDRGWLAWGEELQRTMDTRFWDAERGGYYNSQSGDAAIILRLKEDYDGAEPAPSSVAAVNLHRFAAIFDDGEDKAEASRMSYRARGRACLAAFRQQWSGTPYAMPQMLTAMELALDDPRHVVIVGDPTSAAYRALIAVIHERLGRRRSLIGITSDEDRAWFGARAPWLTDMREKEGRPTAYVCEEFTCQAPVSDPEALKKLLG